MCSIERMVGPLTRFPSCHPLPLLNIYMARFPSPPTAPLYFPQFRIRREALHFVFEAVGVKYSSQAH